MICDWEDNVMKIKPSCGLLSTSAPEPLCPVGMVQDECAIECEKLCGYYLFVVREKGLCFEGTKCESGCVAAQKKLKCPKGRIQHLLWSLVKFPLQVIYGWTRTPAWQSTIACVWARTTSQWNLDRLFWRPTAKSANALITSTLAMPDPARKTYWKRLQLIIRKLQTWPCQASQRLRIWFLQFRPLRNASKTGKCTVDQL